VKVVPSFDGQFFYIVFIKFKKIIVVVFSACYRVLHQAVVGHPIQPVNKATLNVLYDSFKAVNVAVQSNFKVIDQISDFLTKNDILTGTRVVHPDGVPQMYGYSLPVKPFKSYSRKNSKPSEDDTPAHLPDPAVQTNKEPAVAFNIEGTKTNSNVKGYKRKRKIEANDDQEALEPSTSKSADIEIPLTNDELEFEVSTCQSCDEGSLFCTSSAGLLSSILTNECSAAGSGSIGRVGACLMISWRC